VLVGVSYIDSGLDRSRKHPDITVGTAISSDEGAESAPHAIHHLTVVYVQLVDFRRKKWHQAGHRQSEHGQSPLAWQQHKHRHFRPENITDVETSPYRSLAPKKAKEKRTLVLWPGFVSLPLISSVYP
jgi:hypothetical protein